MSVTSKDLARLCGVSQGTIDRALNNRPGISEKTREKILKTAESLGYRPDLLASSLARGKTKTLGVVAFDLYNRFFAQIINVIETEARKAGYFVYLTLTDKDKLIEKQCVDHLTGRKVDGIILASVNQGREYESYLESAGIPIVTIGNKISDGFAYIGIDDFNAMKEAAKFVVTQGYERIVYLSPPLVYRGKANIYAQEQRFLGFESALQECKNSVRYEVIESWRTEEIMNSLNLKDIEKTVVICSSDIYALKLLNHLQDKGIKVPEDIGIMGFDNIDTLEYVKPRLATVGFPYEELGREVVRRLIGSIETGEKASDKILEHCIIEGNSL